MITLKIVILVRCRIGASGAIHEHCKSVYCDRNINFLLKKSHNKRDICCFTWHGTENRKNNLNSKCDR